MKNKEIIILLVFLVLAVSCSKKETKNTVEESPKKSISKGDTDLRNVLEMELIDSINKKMDPVLHLITKEGIVLDTILLEYFKLQIINKAVDSSFVIQKNENRVHKYQQYVKRILLEKNDKIIFDTVLTKKFFSDFVSTEYLNKAIFNRIRFNSINKEDRVMHFFGTLTIPETDSTFPFDLRIFFENDSIIANRFVDEPI